MAANNNITADTIASLRKDVEICKEARDAAKESLVKAETAKQLAEDNLRGLGVEPENAAAEIQRLNDEIAAKIEAVKGSIPYDTLRQLKRYPA